MENFKKSEQEPSFENIEKIDAEIKELLESLDSFDFNFFGPEIQEEWYWVEQEANVAKDRIAAKTHLEQFVEKLKKKNRKINLFQINNYAISEKFY